MRLIGLDYGEKTVGVAATDALGMTVQPLETVVRKEENKLRKTCARIEALIAERNTEALVLGLPLHMDGSDSAVSEKVLAFKTVLERRTGLPVYLQDERLTTAEANEILKESGVRPEDRKTYIDKIAAAFILEDFIENQKKNNS